MNKLCQCGCGQSIVIKHHHKWRGIPQCVPGHYSRIHNGMSGKKMSEETRRKMSAIHLGKPSGRKGKVNSPETRAKISEASKRTWQKPEYRALQSLLGKTKRLNAEQRDKISKAHMGKIVSDETRRKIADARRGKPLSEEHKRKLSKAGKGRKFSSTHRQKISEAQRSNWKDPSFSRKMGAVWGVKPNKPETFLLNLLNRIYPGQWKYTGDFSFTINGKCPDFVNCNGQKKIIEFFGSYWHKDENPQDRADIFKPFGYETLVIWEHELKHMDSVINKIHAFMVA